MAGGFRDSYDFTPIIGWELYQVTLDKYVVMFFFNNGWGLLNVAHSFSLLDPRDPESSYKYEIYGPNKSLAVDSILRERVVSAMPRDVDRLDLHFSNGRVLTVYDDPSMRSWWFMGGHSPDNWESSPPEIAALSDLEPDCMSEEQRASRGAA